MPYYHCSVRKKGSKDIKTVNDLSADELRKTIVAPYHAGRRFTVSGLLITSDDLEEIKIAETDQPLEWFRERHEERTRASNITDLATDRKRLPISQGRDITYDLLFAAGPETFPPAARAGALALTDLHPRIRDAATELFLDGHYPQAVQAAFTAVNVYVRERAVLNRDGGVQMMHSVFSINPPQAGDRRLHINSLSDQSEIDEQDGFRFLFAGSQLGIRNPQSHGRAAIQDPVTALEALALASFLARAVERAVLK